MWYRKWLSSLAPVVLMSAIPLLGNSPPVITTPSGGTLNLTVKEMNFAYLKVEANDPDGDPLTFTFRITQDLPVSGKAKLYTLPSIPNWRGFGVDQASIPGSNTALGISDYDGYTVVVACDVSDGVNVTAATFNVTIQGYNRPPVAVITGEFGSPTNRIAGGSSISFTSESYDPDGGKPTHQWFVGPTYKGTYCPGQHIVGRGTDTPNPGYSIPYIPTNYPEIDQVFRLELADGLWLVKQEVTAYLKASPGGCSGTTNQPPIVSAGASQCAVFDQTVTLNGSASDPEGNPLIYSWTQLSATTGSAVTLSNPNVPKPTFLAPSTTQFLTFRLTVSDGVNIVSADTTVSVQSQCGSTQPPPGELEPYGTCEPGNQPAVPTIISAPSPVNGGELVQLSGTAVDPDMTPPCTAGWVAGAALKWEVLDSQGLAITLNPESGYGTQVSFMAPMVQQDTTIQIGAAAFDACNCGSRTRANITIKSQTQANPRTAKVRYSLDGQSFVEANPASPVMITAPKEINLSAQVEGFTSPVYAWSKVGTGTLNPVTGSTSKFGVQSFSGTSPVDVTISLNVKESTDATKTATATMVIRIVPASDTPVAKILSMSPSADVQAGDVISLAGEGKRSDGGAGTFEYRWSASCSAGTAVTVFSYGDKALVVAPPPTNGEAMEVTVKLAVSENGISSTEDVVQLNVVAPTLYYAHLAVGQLDGETRLDTQLMLVNDSPNRADGTLIEFFDSEGRPMELTVDGELRDSVVVSLPARTAKQLLFTGDEVKVGWARVKSPQKLTGLALFRYLHEEELLGEAALFSSAPGKRFTTVAAAGRNPELGLALANPSASPASFKLRLKDEVTGLEISTGEPEILAPYEHKAKFLAQWFPAPEILDVFKGGTLTVEVESGSSLVATVIKLRGLQLSAIPLASRMD